MDTVSGIVRHVLTALGGAGFVAGYEYAEAFPTIMGAISFVAGMAWSIIAKVK